MKKVILFFLTLIVLVVTGCDDKITNRITFVGDSIIARWDLNESFPMLLPENLGVSGSGVEYIESLAGRFEGKTVVTHFGSNDINTFTDDGYIEGYAQRYIAAIRNLGAAKTFILSVPPRNFIGDREDVNLTILKFNGLIRRYAAENPSLEYVDITSALMRDGTINPQYTLDGLHLNIYGYAIVTKILTKELE